MILLDSPFVVLSVDPINSRLEINSKYEDSALFSDNPSLLENAKDTLINPAKRIMSELLFLPDLPKEEREMVVNRVKSKEKIEIDEIKNDGIVSRINIALFLLELLLEENSSDNGNFKDEILSKIREYIEEIILEFEKIDISLLQDKINEARDIAHFPKISDQSVLKSALKDVRNYYKSAIFDVLNQIETKELISNLTILVGDLSKESVPTLLEDVINQYEIKASTFFELEKKNIDELIERIKGNSKSDKELLRWMIEKLIEVTKNFDFVAQPLQLFARTKGINHQISTDLANQIRNFAVELYNEYHLGSLTQFIIKELKLIFAEDLVFVERLNSDLAYFKIRGI